MLQKIALSVILLAVLGIGLFLYQNSQTPIYANELAQFDKYYSASQLPIIENEDSLCHGLSVGSDFSKIMPKWAIGKLIEVKPEFSYTLLFKGDSLTGEVPIPMSLQESQSYELGRFYKVDMMNICRHLFLSADSMNPSRIRDTFVKPVLLAE